MKQIQKILRLLDLLKIPTMAKAVNVSPEFIHKLKNGTRNSDKYTEKIITHIESTMRLVQDEIEKFKKQ